MNLPLQGEERGQEVPDEREQRFAEAERKYPRITGNTWQGMKLLELGSSLNSISASIEDYEELPGFRDMPYSDFGDPKTHFYAADDWRRADSLAERIKHNQKIEPLIVGIDSRSPYILEGQGRFVALSKLGYRSFPALVLIDYDT
jgi:hypothetical protein